MNFAMKITLNLDIVGRKFANSSRVNNILFIGIENCIDIIVFNFSNDNPEVSIENGIIRSERGLKYYSWRKKRTSNCKPNCKV